jgi:hypothetical protein
MRRLFLLWLLGGGLALGSCIDRYTPEVAPAAQANLVVDGFLNAQGTTVIKLARTFSVNTKNTAPPEARAQVAIVDDAGRRYALAENPAGTYTSGALSLDPGRQYQLRITTAQGRDYASDSQPVVPAPPIDSLTWQLTPVQGVQIYLATHAASSAARYYRWEYDETYQFTSAFESSIEYVPSTNRLRGRRESIYRCWRTESSTAILQSNSTQLSQNTIASYPLQLVLPDVRLRYGYSILVRQVAQTQAEYDYWERLRKNTENLGTVNDPLPGKVTGNVHALADATEPVLGYVGVHSVAQKRLFINAITQLPKPQPASVFFDPAYANCLDTEGVTPLSRALAQLKTGNSTALQPIISLFTGDTIGSTMASPACADCRVRGTNIKPSYWP